MFTGILEKIYVVYYKQLYVYLHDNPDAKKGKPNGSLPNASEGIVPEIKAFSFFSVSCCHLRD